MNQNLSILRQKNIHLKKKKKVVPGSLNRFVTTHQSITTFSPLNNLKVSRALPPVEAVCLHSPIQTDNLVIQYIKNSL